ncbi:hypothetical protein C9374_010267 [Naegleria lovaniensis]|uniref:alpha-1,6-mannosyl-glycoprotein 6-beta-N-acetylglucosaminyltransferase n=1 Tax=Naegleria lovaniensis TaxID=51637 RepID=A0AA88GHD5_NAELO|nr:uncharacterized protein C9374_010267 [Naegleria lovaniensis]KAG2374893.1 hypothetical protein C9374_010267 [Naegleria lovaniensis]
MKNKIALTLPIWLRSVGGVLANTNATRILSSNQQPKILICNYLKAFGFVGEGKHPLGELTQWTDLLTALALQDFQIYYAHDLQELVNDILPYHSLDSFHVIFTDYSALKMYFSRQLGVLRQKDRHVVLTQKEEEFKCKLRVLDSFGTHAKYNAMDLTDMKSMDSYCCWNLNLKQYLTLQPSKIPDPVNQFLGTATPLDFEGSQHEDQSLQKKRKNTSSGKYRALIWAKEVKYFDNVPSTYLEVISQKFELITTLEANEFHVLKQKFPNVAFTNLGILSRAQYVKTLRESAIYVGLGTPYIGPSSIEALAFGNVIFNPRISPRKLSDMGKPTDEIYTSQSGYLESIGSPNVVTLNMHDTESIKQHVENVVMLLNQNHGYTPPYLPSEFTLQSFFYRVYSIVNSYNFCGRD